MARDDEARGVYKSRTGWAVEAANADWRTRTRRAKLDGGFCLSPPLPAPIPP
jgi:hypothetical protein